MVWVYASEGIAAPCGGCVPGSLRTLCTGLRAGRTSLHPRECSFLPVSSQCPLPVVVLTAALLRTAR